MTSDFTFLFRRLSSLENRVRQIEQGFGNEITLEEAIQCDLAAAIGSMNTNAVITIGTSGSFEITEAVGVELSAIIGGITENAGGESE